MDWATVGDVRKPKALNKISARACQPPYLGRTSVSGLSILRRQHPTVDWHASIRSAVHRLQRFQQVAIWTCILAAFLFEPALERVAGSSSQARILPDSARGASAPAGLLQGPDRRTVAENCGH